MGVMRLQITKKGLLKTTVALAIAGLGLWGSAEINAHAAFDTGAAALKGAPQGVYLGSGTASNYFTIDNSVSTASGTNSAHLVDAGSPGGSKNSAIQISKAGSKQSWGSIWSKQQSFDLNQSETASMWIYASGEGSTSVGDGMAFVLQNGGTNVYSGPGESMGVWGVQNSDFSKTNLADTAIKNSWALEFDTFPNVTIPDQPAYGIFDNNPISEWSFAGSPTSFDVNGDGNSPANQTPIKDTHIASNYPGESSTYSETKVPYAYGENGYGPYYYYTMKHEGFLDEGPTGSSKLSDRNWHHITIQYTPPTTAGDKGSMTYTYNDKNPNTGLPQPSTDYATVPIDPAKFNLADGQSKVRWGFTGSTGDATENNYVIFDQLPGQAQTEATASLMAKIDMNHPDEYVTVGSGSKQADSIPGGTDVKLTYTFGRTDGDEDWKSVNANLNIPSGLALSSGTITYPDASYTDSNNNQVDLSKLTTNADGTSQSLPVSLANGGLTMSGTQHATITLYGKAKDLTSDLKGTPQLEQTSYFTGINAASSAKTPAFSITPKVNAKLAVDTFGDKGRLKVNYGSKEAARVVGVAVPQNPLSVSMEDITIHPSINGVAQSPENLMDIYATEMSPSLDYFSYEIPNNKLHPGANTISFYATYGSGSDEVTSTTVNRTVTAGTVGFGHTSGNMTFKPTVLTGDGQSHMIKRDNDWELDVDDSLVKGSEWQVTAKTTGMFADGDNVAVKTPLDGALTYTDAAGKTTELNNSASELIASGTSPSDETATTTNVAQDWTADTGIRLKINDNAVEGNYEGTIDWSVVNSVSPD